MTLRDYLASVAKSLGDFDESDVGAQYQHWDLKSLLAWYNEAMCLVSTYKPQDFVKTKVMKLQPGTTQTACCKQIGAAMEYTDARGQHIAYLRPLDSKTAVRPWRGSVCATQTAPNQSYAPTNTWRMDSATDSFEVYPPVPNAGDYYVKIRCIEQPPAKDIGNLDDGQGDCRYCAAASEWIMYKALSGETDVGMLQASQMHYKAFFDLLGIQVKAMDKFMSQQSNWNSGNSYQIGAHPK
jgi:hypothetical protein